MKATRNSSESNYVKVSKPERTETILGPVLYSHESHVRIRNMMVTTKWDMPLVGRPKQIKIQSHWLLRCITLWTSSSTDCQPFSQFNSSTLTCRAASLCVSYEWSVRSTSEWINKRAHGCCMHFSGYDNLTGERQNVNHSKNTHFRRQHW